MIDLAQEISDAKKNDRIEYHRGFLFNDREVRINQSEEERERSRKIAETADFARYMAETGWGNLAQERMGKFDYRYLFIRGKRK